MSATGTATESSGIRDIAWVFFKLGCIGFGGPAAHIAMMEDEVVQRRKWLDKDQFLDLAGATNLIPGPNSTEMAIHIGLLRGGWLGMLAAGACFIMPAVLITLAFAYVYTRFGTLPDVERFLFGVQPAVIGIIAAAAYRLSLPAVKSIWLGAIGATVFCAYLFTGVNEIVLLFGGGACGLALKAARSGKSGAAGLFPLFSQIPSAIGSAENAPSLLALAGVFLKIGAVLYGSGYVLIALLDAELVSGLGWLTRTQLLDAVAVGQVTPGPVLTTATFIGYILGGWQGAGVATVAIFLPSFFFVLLLHRFLLKLRNNAWVSAFLDAVNVSAVALIAAVAVSLTVEMRPDILQSAVLSLSLGLSVWKRINPAWLVGGGGIISMAAMWAG